MNSNTMSDILDIPDFIVYELGIVTARLLNENQNKLSLITWSDGEANIDTEYSKLACEYCEIAWNKLQQKYPEYCNVKIACVIPDINITFLYSNGKTLVRKIELKSSKSKKMPGSTINNLDINQPLIYCLRPSNDFEPFKIRCSQYHSAMGDSNIDLFQDRTPRPAINFEKMKDINDILPFQKKDNYGKYSWVEHYANCSLNRINGLYSCHNSWQDVMIKIIKKKVLDEYITNTSIEEFCVDKNLLNSKRSKL